MVGWSGDNNTVIITLPQQVTTQRLAFGVAMHHRGEIMLGKSYHDFLSWKYVFHYVSVSLIIDAIKILCTTLTLSSHLMIRALVSHFRTHEHTRLYTSHIPFLSSSDTLVIVQPEGMNISLVSLTISSSCVLSLFLSPYLIPCSLIPTLFLVL